MAGFLLFLPPWQALLALPWFSATEVEGFQAIPKLFLKCTAVRPSLSGGAGGSVLFHLGLTWMRPTDEQSGAFSTGSLWPRLHYENSALPAPSADEAVNPISVGSI